MAESNQQERNRKRIEELEEAMSQFRGSEAALLQARNEVEKRFQQLVLMQEFSQKALRCRSLEELFEHCLDSAVSILGLEVGVLWTAQAARFVCTGFCNASGSLPDLSPWDVPEEVRQGNIQIASSPPRWFEPGAMSPVISEGLWLPLRLPASENTILLILGVPEEKTVFYPSIHTVDLAICQMFQQQAEAAYAYFNELQQRKISDRNAQKNAASYRSLFEDAPLPLVEIDASEIRAIITETLPSAREVVRAVRHVRMLRANKAAWAFYDVENYDELVALTRKTSVSMLTRQFAISHTALLSGERCVLKGHQQTRHGRREVNFHLTVLPGYDDTWERLLVAILDVTEVQQAELLRDDLEKRLKRSEKMEALGLLAGGVAHDLNNVLVSLVGFPDLLMEQVRDQPDAYEMAEMIRDAGIQASAFVQDLLTMARQGLQAQRPLDLNHVVSAYLKSAAFHQVAVSHPGVAQQTELAPGRLEVVGSSTHLTKLVMNLVTNGYEAISGEGIFRISSREITLTEDQLGYENITAGRYALLEIEDSGSGISAAHLPHIFEPFYSRKAMGQLSGTGLGMAVVWGVLRDHKAFIDVDTEVGRGTRFSVYLPLASRAAETPSNPAAPPTATAGNERVLVVDDMPEQRSFLQRVLTRYGYQVHCVCCGEDAVEWLKGNHADMVLLDMIMDPGIDGLVTYERIVEFKPSQPAILVSGYAATERVQRVLDLGVRALVKKPFRPIELIAALQRELKLVKSEARE